jgi:hypothetical protein
MRDKHPVPPLAEIASMQRADTPCIDDDTAESMYASAADILEALRTMETKRRVFERETEKAKPRSRGLAALQA